MINLFHKALESLALNTLRIQWFLRNRRRIFRNSVILSNYCDPKYPVTFNSGGLATLAECGLSSDPKFVKAYDRALSTHPYPGYENQWRVSVALTLGTWAMQLEGDFVECGVNTGANAAAMIDYLNFNASSKTFYLFDTFAGYPLGQCTEEEIQNGLEECYRDSYRETWTEVQETFKRDRVQLIRGLVPDTLQQVSVSQVAYLLLDMNARAPEIAALEHFFPQLVPGGLVLIDDYSHPMHREQKNGYDAFAKKIGRPILNLPTGQGVLIKSFGDFRPQVPLPAHRE